MSKIWEHHTHINILNLERSLLESTLDRLNGSDACVENSQLGLDK